MQTARQVTLNTEQGLFVIPAGHDGYSCYGFTNCYDDSAQLATQLQRPDLLPKKHEIGSLAQYQAYRGLLLLAAKEATPATWYSPGTPDAVKTALDQGIKRGSAGSKFRLFYGNMATGLDSLEEFEVCGYIGRSTGILKIPLLIGSRADDGGCAISTNHIVRIVDMSNKATLYQHPTYHMPQLKLVTDVSPKGKHAPFVFFRCNDEGEMEPKPLARFETRQKAEHWLGFLKGKRITY